MALLPEITQRRHVPLARRTIRSGRNRPAGHAFAPAAVAAVGTLLAEVGQQMSRQTAVLLGIFEHSMDASHVVLLPSLEASAQRLTKRVQIARHFLHSVSFMHPRCLNDQVAQLFQVAQGGHDPLARLADRLAHLGRVEREPGSALACLPKHTLEEVGTPGVEAGENLLGRLLRLELEAGVERAGRPDHVFQLQVREQGADHKRPHVVLDAQFRDRHVEHRAPPEHVADQRRNRFGRGRIAVGEVLQDDHVAGTRQKFADRPFPVASGPADLLGVALQALGQIVVVDVADVGLVDAHSEGDRGHHDHPVRGHELLLHRIPLV